MTTPTPIEEVKVMTPQEFLKSKGIFSLDTKKRYNEVVSWMREYRNKTMPTREQLVEVINNVVDEQECLGAANIADGILGLYKKQ